MPGPNKSYSIQTEKQENIEGVPVLLRSSKKPKSGEQRQSDIRPQNGPIMARKTATTRLQLQRPISTYFQKISTL
jgi:hypothetical protein